MIHSSSPNSGVGKLSRFLLLPREIRIEIYEYIFEISKAQPLEVLINIDTLASLSAPQLVLNWSKQPDHHPDLTIFRCSRQIYSEALPVFYQHCLFFPPADHDAIAMFFGRMTTFACSSIRRIVLRPRPQKTLHRRGPNSTTAKVVRGPSWISACEILSRLFVGLEEVFIQLHPLYGYELAKGIEMGWIIRPLSRLYGVKKTLVFVGSRSENGVTTELVERWDDLMKKADREAEEYLASRKQVVEARGRWTSPHWVVKRSKVLES